MPSFRRAISQAYRMMLVLSFCGTALWSQSLYQGPEQGSIAGGATVSTGSMAAATEARTRQWLPPEKERVQLLPDSLNRVSPSAPMGTNEFYDSATGASESFGPRTVSGFAGIPDVGAFIPPDPHMAAGPDHLMGVVNSSFGIFDKSGNMLKLIDADAWFANVLPNGSPFDPQIVYDHHAERWIMVWVHLGTTSSRLLLSISDDSDPLGTWCNWSLPDNIFGNIGNEFFGDYPKLGVDANAVYVTSNLFRIPMPRTFQGTRLRIIPKEQLLDNACGAITWNDLWDFRDPANLDVRVGTVVPAVTFGAPSAQYFLNDSPHNTGTFMTLWELYDPLGSPFLIGTNIPVTSGRAPSNADQLGGGTPLISVNGRQVRNVVYIDGSLWTAHSVGGGTGGAFAFARYVRIDPLTYTTIEDVAFGADNFWYYFPAIQPDGKGNMFMVFTRSGLTEYASARYTGRLNADPPGLQASVLLKAGEANYVKTFSDTRNRWGDYLGIALDPADNSKVWMFGQYAASEVGTGVNADRWGTWFGQASFTPLQGKHMRFEPDSIHYATLESGQTSLPIPVTVSNVGATSITVASVTISTPSFVLAGVPALPKTLASFNDLSFTVTFQPTQAGVWEDTITVRDNNNQTLLEIPLAGRALGVAALQGVVQDSLSHAPIKARIQFFRGDETTPRAIATTEADGSYSVLVLEGEYTVDIAPEIPYPPERRALSHTLNGTTSNFALLPAPVLLVDDDDDSTAASQEVYTALLAQSGYKYALWNRQEEGGPVPSARLPLLTEPRLVVWFTGDTDVEVLTQEDRNTIISHLANGNPVLLTGDNIAETAVAGDSLLTKYLGVEFNGNFSQIIVRGFAGDPIGNGLVSGAQGASKDILQLRANPRHQVNRAFRYQLTAADTVTTRIAAVRAADNAAKWRAAYFGFRLEIAAVTTRRTIFERTIAWLTDTVSTAVATRPAPELPREFYLSQNHPNPFNPTTLITFHLPTSAVATLKVFDLAGREVATLVNGKMSAGEHQVHFDGRALAAGVYLYRLEAGEQVATRKLVLLK